MARNIFIFSNTVVLFLTIVSKTAFCTSFSSCHDFLKTENFQDKDTINSIFQDGFESGNIQEWKQTDDWEVSASEKISGTYSLKHLKTSSGTSSSIFHKLSADWNNFDLEWSFKIKNGNWDPSSTNKFWFYLCADTIQTNLISGFAVGVNFSGSTDLLSIWRIKNGKADSLIIQTDLDWNASTLATIVVRRTTRGNWTLNYQKEGESISIDFSGTDLSTLEFKNIGINFNFTTTRAGQIWIDDVSVKQIPAGPFIQNISLKNSHQLILTFNRPVNPASLLAGNFKLTDENNLNIPIIELKPVFDNSVELNFGNVRGTVLNLKVSGITDLSGKIMNPENKTIEYTFSPEVGSVLINEILFNPFSGGVDFVELVNVSEQTVPVHHLKLATRNDTLGLKQIYSVSTESRYLFPGQFLVCTRDSAILAGQYFTHDPESFCVMKTLPGFSDDAGTAVLLNDSLEVLDEFSYSAKMHSSFLSDENGVSLERISVDKPATDLKNWASAAASVGFATPGLPNSQTESETDIQDKITPEPKAFSPNGDGYNDELIINYQFSKPGYIANVQIFNAIGQQVRFLVKNESLAQEGSWFWNGKSESGQRQNIGVYIILVEIFDQDGHIKAFKKACTLTDRLD
ncbi:MAG: gliding motility-associated C-terminal domain-containing protein [Prolixibacteraceae bacterium]